MYQFTEMFKEVQTSEKAKTFRWRGLGIGLVSGWIPAWVTLHFTNLSGWFFLLIWLAALAIGCAIGNAVKK